MKFDLGILENLSEIFKFYYDRNNLQLEFRFYLCFAVPTNNFWNCPF
jgi:hypothetical protein